MMRRVSKKSMMVLFAAVAVLTVLAAVLLFNSNAVAREKPAGNAYYRCIHVEQGDTLWHFAEEYSPNKDNESLCRYVDHLRSLNNLNKESILQIGQPLMVIYYQ